MQIIRKIVGFFIRQIIILGILLFMTNGLGVDATICGLLFFAQLFVLPFIPSILEDNGPAGISMYDWYHIKKIMKD